MITGTYLFILVGIGALYAIIYWAAGKYDEQRRRAEWAENYAGELERALKIPSEDRITKDSWKALK